MRPTSSFFVISLLRHEQRNGEATNKNVTSSKYHALMKEEESMKEEDTSYWARLLQQTEMSVATRSYAGTADSCPSLHKCLPLVLLPRQRTCLQH
jgi:hypothetical protein